MADARIVEPSNLRTVATGLRFPEGPVALADGSVLVVEIARGTVTRVAADGAATVVADCGGGPNGAAIGPDGALYVCDNGGCFDWHERAGMLLPGSPPPATWRHGALRRVDLASGDVTTLLTQSGDVPLRAPNDLVLDAEGGIWFTDHGVRAARASDRTGVHWCRPDGSDAREVIFPLDAPNGIGLSPAGDRLYVAETSAGQVSAWPVTGPGEVEAGGAPGYAGGRLLGQPGGGTRFDSLAVDGDGWVCVATIGREPGITAYAPDGSEVERIPLPDPVTTNICFGQDGRTAYATLSATGQLVAFDWPRPGGRTTFTA